ncbi:serine protease [Pedobacter frigoris]|uniref:S1C family serine protease n=1 Tax=Pedobacter frigoris TaxID=2571272 RepID=UPI00292EC5A3|nr:serine protease [Pedobacter frigoris]
MRNEIELDGIIEDYLNGKLTEAEAQAFEQLRLNDASVDHKVVSHKVFMEAMADYAEVMNLKEKMDAAHAQIDVDVLSRQLGPHPSFIVNIWRKNKAAIAVAASFIFLSMIMLYSIQQNTEQIGKVELMNRDLAKIKTSTNNLIRKINSGNAGATKNLKPANYGGTGFALTSNGYILTNLHVVKDADSVYVQDSKGNEYKVRVIPIESQKDLAILKIESDSFTPLPNLPYRLKQNGVGMGDEVYTIGFPKDGAVYGRGYVSSKTGYNADDSTQYQVGIDVNPGNSGGPLLDQYGNVIGVISAKLSQVDGATFAIKAKYIQEALNSISKDSLGKSATFNKRNSLQRLSRNQQFEKLKDYVFMVKVFK